MATTPADPHATADVTPVAPSSHWPEGFEPNPDGAADPERLAAFLGVLGVPTPAATLDAHAGLRLTGSPSPLGADAPETVPSMSTAALDAEARRRVGDLLTSPAGLAFLDLLDWIPQHTMRDPEVVLLAGRGFASPDVPAGPGERGYRCKLTNAPFALPEGQPVPALGFREHGPDGYVGEGSPGYFAVHPDLVKAGPGAVATAIAFSAQRRLKEASMALWDAARWLTMSSGLTAEGVGHAWPSAALPGDDA